MNNLNHKNLAYNAWLLYKLAQTMQKTMLEMFFNEFCDIDEEERCASMQREEKLPF